MPASPDFILFESAIDQNIQNLVAQKSLRDVHALLAATSYMTSIDMKTGRPLQEQERTCGSSRLGYLVPLLRDVNTLGEPTSADDALWAWGEPEVQALSAKWLLAYSDFCSIAPFVHREVLTGQLDDGTLVVQHRDEEARATEERDIILSNLALPFAIHSPAANSAWFDAQTCQLPNLDDKFMILLSELATWYTESIFELIPISSQAMESTFGFSECEYRRFVGACYAVSQLHISIADAITRRSFADTKYGESSVAASEMREWTAPCLKKDALLGLIGRSSGLETPTMEMIYALYAVTNNGEWVKGEGYCPPFIEIGDYVAFTPLAIRHSMSFRNALYTMMVRDQEAFDNLISQHLEPRLITLAEELFSKHTNYRLAANIAWGAGEIDLVVYDSNTNSALIVEVKGVVMPEGARMVHRAEGRLLEGISQLARFTSLPSREIDAILSKAFGISVRQPHIQPGLLTWAGFGTTRIWRELEGIAPLNPAILLELLRKRPAIELDDFPDEAHSLICYIVKEAKPEWTRQRRQCGELEFDYPTLEFDGMTLSKYTRQLFASN